MNSIPFILLFSLGPIAGVYIWYRVMNVPVSARWFLTALALGIIALALSALLQYICFLYIHIENIFFAIFIRTALLEEGGRVCVFFVLFAITDRLRRQTVFDERFAAASGLAAALSFASLESIWYTIDAPRFALLRVLTAAPLHAACGARSARAARLLRTRPLEALVVLLRAVGIHGFYNYFAASRGFLFAFAPLLALLALTSQVIYISQKDRAGAVP